jgi:catechol 2,3-dioxygenase-like lactoylglutathione lyase family enzyme
VVSEVTMRGTHLGEWMGMRPTGRAMRVTAVNVDRVVEGRLAEHGGAANLLGPLLEAGAVRVAGHGEEGAPPAPFVQVTPFLHVPDIEAAVAFFRDILGFAVPYRMSGYAYVERDGIAVRMLGEPGRALPGYGETRMTMYIDVRDVDALFRELEPRLRTLPEGHWWPPGDKSWHQRELHVKLPDGHWLAFGQPVRAD